MCPLTGENCKPFCMNYEEGGVKEDKVIEPYCTNPMICGVLTVEVESVVY